MQTNLLFQEKLRGLGPLDWHRHYQPMYGNLETFLAASPDVFARRSTDGAVYLRPRPSTGVAAQPCLN